jgi:hypothetical protein
MSKHRFLLTPGEWVGSGTINLSMEVRSNNESAQSSNILEYTATWSVSPKDASGRIECIQHVRVNGFSEVVVNHLSFYDFQRSSFKIDLDSESLGKITGLGLITDKTLAWEYHVVETGFNGLEIFEKNLDHSYTMRAEYTTFDQLRTVIKGSLRKKTNI